MSFGSIFNRFSRRASEGGDGTQSQGSGVKGQAARRARRKTLRAADIGAAVESLEDRRLLAFQYVGFTHTNVPTTPSSPQAYQYNFEVFNDPTNPNDSATMYMRNMNIVGQLQFDYGTTFSSLTNLGTGLTGSPSSLTPPYVTGWNWGTRNPNTENPNAAYNIVGPVALANANSIDTNWNTRDTQTENFILSKVRVFAAQGTVNPTFILNVGDKMPLALEVDFSQAVGTSTIIIRSDTAELYPDSRSWGLPHGAGYDFRASEIYVRAAIDPKYGSNNYAAEHLIQIENAITGGLNARVSEGDFKLLAGASVSGTTDIRLGAGVPPTAFSPYSKYGYGGNGGDILIDGVIQNAGYVNLQVNSVSPRNILTGPSGLISGGSSITLNNAGADGGTIDVRTADFAQHNIFAGTNVGPAADIAINVNQIRGNLTINALPASKATISLTASEAGRQVITNSNFDTIGGLSLAATTLNINRPISTERGDLSLTGNSVTIGSNVSAGTSGIGDLNVVAKSGDISVTSAAVVKAAGDSINLTASGNIVSQARLEATNLNLNAGGSIDTLTRTDTVTAKAGASIKLSDDDAIKLTQVTTTGDGSITVNAKGLLDAVSVSTGGTGDIALTTTAAGLIAKDLKTTNGTIRLHALDGDISAVGDVFVNDANPANPTQDFVLTADKGNVIMSPDATFTVADQLAFNAPLGRVLTPGKITGVTVLTPGSGYVTPPAVSFQSGSGATVTPTVGDGKVTFVKVMNGGGGYVTAPSVVFANAGTGGSGAVATAQITGGVVTGITITNGGIGYGSAPSVSFVGGGGAGAEAVASINGLTALSVTSGGSGYQVPPTVVISSGEGASSGAVNVNATGAITGINVAQGGTAYTAAPNVVIVDSSGSGYGAVAHATLTGGVTNGVATAGGSGYTGAATATVSGSGVPGAKQATGIPLLGVTTASLTGFSSGGSSYAVGDLLTVVAGSGAQVKVTASGGGVTAATVTMGGANYGVGDTLYLNDAAVGASGARLRVTSVTTGGVITGVTAIAGGTGYSSGMLLDHVGGNGAVYQVTGVDFSGAITGTVVYRAGSGYTTRPTALVGGSGSGAVPTFVDTQYTVVGYRAVQPGTAYSAATITVSDATGTGAVLAAGVEQLVAAIVVDVPGTGYDPATTTVTLVPVASGGGATSSAVSVNGLGAVTSVNLSTDGRGYVAPPTVTIVDRSGSGTGAQATATTSQGVTGITLSSAGAGYTSAPTVTISGGGGSGATAVATVSGGYVTGITILEPGSGYTSTPTVTFTGGGATQQAQAAAATSYVVTGITVTSGGLNYNPSTTDIVITPVGSGATGVANLDPVTGTVSSIRITDNGSGYSATTPPTVTIVPFGTGALATSSLAGSGVGAVTVTNPGAGYAVAPKVVFTPNLGGTTAVATIGNVAQLSANRLSWTALEQPLPALLDQFSVAAITLTGAGDLTIDRPSSDLTLEGAVTKDGSVYVTAQKLTVTGAVTAGDFNSSRTETVSLVATGADLILNAPVTAPAAVSLSADAGAIVGSSAGLVTTKALDILALNGAAVTTKVETVSGKVTGTGAGITINEADDLTVGTATTALAANNGPISVTAAGAMAVNLVNAGTSGSVTLVAGSNLTQAVVGDAAEIVAATATLTSKQGRIDLDTDVQTLSASALSSTIDIDNVSTKAVTLQNVVAANNVRVSAASPMTAQSVTSNLSNVSLTTVTPVGTTAANSILVGTVSAVKGVATLVATGDVLAADPTGSSPNILATTGRVSAVSKSDGLINLRTAVGTLGALANSNVTIVEADAITLGEPTGPVGFQSVKSNKGSVNVTAGGTITATDVQATAAKESVQLTSTGGGIQLASILTNASSGQVTLTANKSITDTDATVDVTAKNVTMKSTTGSIGAVDAPVQLSVATVTASAPGALYFTNDKAISLTSITGGEVGIGAQGAITQTGPIVATSLVVSGNGAPITLDTQANQLGAFGATNPAGIGGAGSVVVKDTTGSLDILQTNVGALVITAAGAVTQSGTITSPTVTVQGNFTDPIALDTQPNAIGSFAASNGSAGVGVKSTTDLDIAFIQGGPVNIVSGGTLTQSGFINATNLSVTGSGSPIILNTQTNKVDGFQATNPGGSVTFQDATGGLVIGKSNVGSMTLFAAGPVTQSGAIAAERFAITGSGFDAITLDTQDNDFGRFTASNHTAAVSVKDAVGDLDIGFIQGGPVSISVNGGLTQSGFINATDLVLKGTGAGAMKLDTQPNVVNTLQASNGVGNITFASTKADPTATGDLVIVGLDGKALSITAPGDITQTGPITGDSIDVVSTGAGVNLPLQTNVVNAVSGSAVKDFLFTNFTDLAAGPITVTGTNANIILTSVSGDIDVVGNLTAPNLVSLNAPNGTFTLVPPNTISANILSYSTSTPPTYNPADVPDTIAVNGNLTINKPGQTVTFGNFVTTGTISITAGTLTVNGPLVTTGAGKSVTLSAQTGGVTFVGTGSAEALGTGGTTTITAAGPITGTATNPVSGSTVTLVSGGAITLPGVVKAGLLDVTSTGGAITLDNAKNTIDTLKVSNGNRAVTIVDSKGLSITSVTGGNVSLSLGGHLTQTGPLVATSATLKSTFGNMILTNAGNDVGSLAIDNGDRIVSYVDKSGLTVAGIKAGTLKLATAGDVTQSASGPIVAATANVINTAGTVTLNANGNDFGSLKVDNGNRNVTVVDKNDISLAGVTSGYFTLATVGSVTQTAPVTATGLVVATVGGTVTLTDAGNDADVLQISNGNRPASFTDKDDIYLSTIQAGAFTLRAGGPVSQGQPATTTSFDVATTSGGVSLNNAGNSLGTLSAALSAAGAPLTVVNNGVLNIAQVSAQGPVTISTLGGGNVNIGPTATPTAKLQTTSTVNFSGVSGGVFLRNNGTIVAPGGVTVPAGKKLQWVLSSNADSGAGSLRDTIQSINSLKAPSQVSYAAPTTIKLASALPSVLVPLSVVGNGNLTLDGTSAGSTAHGLAFAATAAGSSVKGVTLQNFGQSGVWLSGAAGSTVSGITVSNSLYGILASGALASGSTNSVVTGSSFIGNGQGALIQSSGLTFGLPGQGNVITGSSRTTAGITLAGTTTGTIVQGNAISGAPTAIFISAAIGATVGGYGTAEYNSVSFATNGVFGTGTCTGTSVIKTSFGQSVTTKYNTSAARGLTIVP